MVVVVSPLISIMKDQVSSLNDKQLSAISVTYVVNGKEEAILGGKYGIVYISPEQLPLGLKMTSSLVQTWSQGRESTVFMNNVIKIVDRIYDLRNYLCV